MLQNIDMHLLQCLKGFLNVLFDPSHVLDQPSDLLLKIRRYFVIDFLLDQPYLFPHTLLISLALCSLLPKRNSDADIQQHDPKNLIGVGM